MNFFNELTHLTINTIEKPGGMTAQAMPAVPLALLQVMDLYAYRLRKMGLPFAEIYDLLPSPSAEGDDGEAYENEVARTFEAEVEDAELRPPESGHRHHKMELTVRSLNALRWTAKLGMECHETYGLSEVDRSLCARIRRNCDELKTVFRTAKNKTEWKLTAAEGYTLEKMLSEGKQAKKLGISREQYGRIHAIWDIGTETVVAQTSISITGDVRTRMLPGRLSENDPLIALHSGGVETAMSTWRFLIDTAIKLFDGLLDRVGRSFGGRGGDAA